MQLTLDPATHADTVPDTYASFVSAKGQRNTDSGFEPVYMPDFLFDFQRHLVEWAVRKGRAAILADCGLGKTPLQLVWAENVVRHTAGRVLILTPLAVSHQTVREGAKFGIEVKRSEEGELDSRIVVTNYERLGHFNPTDFSGVVCDESSILKNFSGRTKAAVTEFCRTLPYRLLCTATAAPNDFYELGTSSEALGYLGYSDMLSRFFKQEVRKDYLGWGRAKYRFRGHAQQPFWQWVVSWARVCRKPSDLGFDDRDFMLPPLEETEIVVKTAKSRPGMLFALPARDLREQRQERRNTIEERCERAARIAEENGAAVVWCHLNAEGDLLEKIIPDALQVSGSMSDDQKEERLLAFQRGELRTLITKPKIGCFGLNWQHCRNVVTFPSHSWEQYYQAVRRCWRFGQTKPVTVSIITTEGEQRVLRNLQRKAKQADRMFDELLAHANDALAIGPEDRGNTPADLPSWMQGV